MSKKMPFKNHRVRACFKIEGMDADIVIVAFELVFEVYCEVDEGRGEPYFELRSTHDTINEAMISVAEQIKDNADSEWYD
ncbi:MAG: hypothetical protein EOO77_22170 [Oxalobacteraceae bacterium]|nr:MAG: hypothetical protein EOO77_22170 [Oxalobacteraceae bacterium]